MTSLRADFQRRLFQASLVLRSLTSWKLKVFNPDSLLPLLPGSAWSHDTKARGGGGQVSAVRADLLRIDMLLG